MAMLNVETKTENKYDKKVYLTNFFTVSYWTDIFRKSFVQMQYLSTLKDMNMNECMTEKT